MTTWLKSNRWPLIIALAYTGLAVAYGLANPPFEATDEIRHFRYVRYITLNASLPPVSVEASKQLQAHHPPLYYALAALLTAPIPSLAGADYTPPINPFWGFRDYEPTTDNKNQYLHAPDETSPFSSATTLIVFVARWLSTIFGLGIVLTAYRLGRLLVPEQVNLALALMAFVAFNPTLLHSAASINNDAAVGFFGAWAVLEAVAVAQNKASRWTAVRFGLALSLGLMSKSSVGVLGLLALAAWLVPLRLGWRGVLRDALIIAALLAVITGWWFVRNYLASGDLMGLSDYQSAWQGNANRAVIIQNALAGLPFAWTTLWGRFDYGQVVLPGLAYNLWGLATLLAIAGFIRAGRRSGSPGLWVVVTAILLSLAGWGVLMVTIPATANARLILYVFPAIGLLFVLGWHELWPGHSLSLWILSIGNLVFSLAALFGYLAPAFAYPSHLASLPAQVTPASASFEGAAEIVGYTVAPATVQPGGQATVTVYWKPLAQTATPLQVFVHLIDSQGIIAAQRDTYPGLGKAPTTSWQVGQVFADTYRVFMPDTVYAPETATVRVGLWDVVGGRPLVVNNSDALAMGTLSIQPNAGDLPNPISVNFNNSAQLISYSLDKRVLSAGGTLQLQTYWHINSKLDMQYSAFTHVVGNDGRIWALTDSSILPFTTTWDPARVNGETRPIKLAKDTPPGQYTLEFGLTFANKQTGQQRVPVLAADGHGTGDHIDLAVIRVTP